MEADLQNKLWSAVSCLYHLYQHPTWPTLAGVKIDHNSPVERNSRRLLSVLSPGLFTSVAESLKLQTNKLRSATTTLQSTHFLSCNITSDTCSTNRRRLDEVRQRTSWRESARQVKVNQWWDRCSVEVLQMFWMLISCVAL